MKMKILIWSLLLMLTFSINIAFAAKGGDPLAAVWAAIANLQEQIDNIQLIPGPQGEDGQPGSQGPVGPSLMVVDGQGVNVGHLVDMKPSSISSSDSVITINVVVFDTNVNKVVIYDPYTAKADVPQVSFLYFPSTDCTGNPLMSDVESPYFIIELNGTGLLYAPNDPSDIFNTTVIAKSILRDDLTCELFTMGLPRAAKLYPVEIPAYVAPLRIIEQ